MAIFSTHLLNSVDGSHAGNVQITLSHPTNGQVFSSRTDEGGRLRQEIPAPQIDTRSDYELVFDVSEYWSDRNNAIATNQAVSQIVMRFRMTNPEGQYHMPVIISPNGYSTWWSG